MGFRVGWKVFQIRKIQVLVIRGVLGYGKFRREEVGYGVVLFD